MALKFYFKSDLIEKFFLTSFTNKILSDLNVNL